VAGYRHQFERGAPVQSQQGYGRSMKLLFTMLLVIAFAVGLSLAAQHNVGYVLLIRAPYRIELSLNLFIVLLLAAFAFLYVLVRLVVHALRVPEYVKNMQSSRRRKHAQTNLIEAIQAFFEGHYAKAEKKALQASELREAADLAAVVAARSAQAQKAYDRRNAYLMPSGEQALGHAAIKTLIQAELLLEQGEFESAMQALMALQKTGYVTPKSLQLEFAAQQGLKNWDAAMALLLQLEKHGVLNAEQARSLRLKSHQENLRRRAFDPQALRAYWNTMPETDKLDRTLALAAARYFSTLGDCTGAHDIIARSLDHHWDRELIALYA
jgi:HemY protein